MDNFNIVDGYLYAAGGEEYFVPGDGMVSWHDGKVIIKFIDNTIIVSEVK